MRRFGLVLAALLAFAPRAAAQVQVVVEYYHVDAVGSVRAVTNASGATVRTHGYTPFGHGEGTGAGSATARFTGKERDPESGFDYFGARYYGSRIGRFTTVDPLMGTDVALFDPQRWNRYSYVGNRPYRVVDPDGRGWGSALFKIGKAVVKGGNIAQEFAGIVDDAKTIVSSESTAGERAWAAVSLGSEALPVSIGDATSLASFAVRRGGDAIEFTRSGFRKGLARLTGAVDEGAHAHHMLPLKFKSFFDNAGLDVNDPRHGAWWNAQQHLRNVRGYNEQWQRFIRDNPYASREEILAFGEQLAGQYGIKINW